MGEQLKALRLFIYDPWRAFFYAHIFSACITLLLFSQCERKLLTLLCWLCLENVQQIFHFLALALSRAAVVVCAVLLKRKSDRMQQISLHSYSGRVMSSSPIFSIYCCSLFCENAKTLALRLKEKIRRKKVDWLNCDVERSELKAKKKRNEKFTTTTANFGAAASRLNCYVKRARAMRLEKVWRPMSLT